MRLATLALLLVTPALAGCFDGGAATKAGGTGGPVTLRLATDDEEVGFPSVDQSREFARRVDALSNGRLRIEPVMDSVKPQPDYARLVARLVTSGELDMGLMPTEYFEQVGVTSLRALDAPFLVTSDALLAQIVGGDVAKEMLSGLERAGVVGLGLLPVGLEHPAGLNGPLLGPEDYQGGVMFGSRAKTRNAVVRSLGASFVQGVMPDRAQHVGGVGAYGLVSGGFVTGNVTLAAWADAIVINARAYEQLDERQRSILATAADQTREWAITSSPSDAQRARAHCEDDPEAGNSVVLASGADIAALQAATASVYGELERDQLTRRVIARIRELKQRSGGDPVAPTACGEPLATLPNAKATTALDGVYRVEVTEAKLHAEGVTDPGAIAEIPGVYTYTFKGGKYCEVFQPKTNAAGNRNPDYVPGQCSTYAVDGDRMITYFSTEPPAVSRWSLAKSGDIKFTPARGNSIRRRIGRVFAADPWKRIGD